MGLKKGQTNRGSFKKGNKPWNTGKVGIKKSWNKGLNKETNESMKRISEKLKGRKLSKQHREKAVRNLRIPNRGIKQQGQFEKGVVPKTAFKKGMSPWNKLEIRTPYPYEFNLKLKNEIRKRDGYICQICGIPQIDCKGSLIVHHIDFDKQNNSPVNLISLCRSCHGKVNCLNAARWKNFFIDLQNSREVILNG